MIYDVVPTVKNINNIFKKFLSRDLRCERVNVNIKIFTELLFKKLYIYIYENCYCNICNR